MSCNTQEMYLVLHPTDLVQVNTHRCVEPGSYCHRNCYRNTLCGWEQRTGATLLTRQLVRAQILWVHFLFYAFRRCLLFFLASLLVLLGILPCQFCSSTVECLVVASCRRSQWTSNYSSTCCALLQPRMLLTVDAFLRLALHSSSLPLFHYGLRCRVLTTLYIQHLSL